MKDKEKVKWTVLLFIAILLFAISLFTGFVYINIITIPLALYVYKYGNPVLFKEYNEKQKEKREQSKIVREAMQETITSGKLFKKDKK